MDKNTPHNLTAKLANPEDFTLINLLKRTEIFVLLNKLRVFFCLYIYIYILIYLIDIYTFYIIYKCTFSNTILYIYIIHIYIYIYIYISQKLS